MTRGLPDRVIMVLIAIWSVQKQGNAVHLTGHKDSGTKGKMAFRQDGFWGIKIPGFFCPAGTYGMYAVSISYRSIVIAKVKVDNRQTNRQTDRQTNKQTDRQDENNISPTLQSEGINNPKIVDFFLLNHGIWPLSRSRSLATDIKEPCHGKEKCLPFNLI